MRIYLTEVKKFKNSNQPDIFHQVFSNEVGFKGADLVDLNIIELCF